MHYRQIAFLISSPDAHALWRGEVKLLSRLDHEGRVPGIDISHRSCSILRGGVRVRQYLLAERSVPSFRRPVLTESDEELLVPGEDILLWRTFVCELGAVAVEGRGDAGEVGNVFVYRLPAVYREIGS